MASRHLAHRQASGSPPWPGKALGAKVIGARIKKKLEASALGLDVAIPTADFSGEILEVTGGKGADLVVNNVDVRCSRCVMSLGGARHRRLRRRRDAGRDGHRGAALKRLKLFGVSNKMRTAAQRAVTVQGFIRDFLPLFMQGAQARDRPRLRLQGPAGRESAHGIRRPSARSWSGSELLGVIPASFTTLPHVSYSRLM